MSDKALSLLFVLFLLTSCNSNIQTPIITAARPSVQTFRCPKDSSPLFNQCSMLGVQETVCGWSYQLSYKCTTYPCARTYTNKCLACKNSLAYYTIGKCPDPMNIPYDVYVCRRRKNLLKCPTYKETTCGYTDPRADFSCFPNSCKREYLNTCTACADKSVIGYVYGSCGN